MLNLNKLKDEFLNRIEKISSLSELKKLESEFLGKTGHIRNALQSLKELLEEEKRKKTGNEINNIKSEMLKLILNKKNELSESESTKKIQNDWIDISAPGKKIEKGHLHPLTKVITEIIEIFNGIGFSVATGPEIETEWNNFDALNIPEEHPAREIWDTFWIKNPESKFETLNSKSKTNSKFKIQNPKFLLRTHTSPVQIRYMEKNNPPFRVIAPGNVFRYEATDASHDFQFCQLEGLMVGDDINIANFKAVIKTFFEQFFKKEIKVRLRPGYFPFVEPGFEVDISCVVCGGDGCGVCKKQGWVELAGAGMVHPNVFKAVGYNPKNWQGFAFGFGIDRLAIMKYKINDIRLFRSGDLRFLKQF